MVNSPPDTCHKLIFLNQATEPIFMEGVTCKIPIVTI